MSYGLGQHLSLHEMADAIVNALQRERTREHRKIVQEIVERELKFFLTCVDSELSAITHGRPIDREECERLSRICRQILGQR